MLTVQVARPRVVNLKVEPESGSRGPGAGWICPISVEEDAGWSLAGGLHAATTVLH